MKIVLVTLATSEGSHTKYGTRRHFNQTRHLASLGVADHALLDVQMSQKKKNKITKNKKKKNKKKKTVIVSNDDKFSIQIYNFETENHNFEIHIYKDWFHVFYLAN